MSIRSNPNPNSFSFDLPEKSLRELSVAIIRKDNLDSSLLAQRLFSEVTSLFEILIQNDGDVDFITLRGTRAWSEDDKLKMQAVVRSLASLLLNEQKYAASIGLDKAQVQQLSTFVPRTDFDRQMVDFFKNTVHPLTARDGGNIALEALDKKPQDDTILVDVTVSLSGACDGCPASRIKTLKTVGDSLSILFTKVSRDNNISLTLGELKVAEAGTTLAPKFN